MTTDTKLYTSLPSPRTNEILPLTFTLLVLSMKINYKTFSMNQHLLGIEDLCCCWLRDLLALEG